MSGSQNDYLSEAEEQQLKAMMLQCKGAAFDAETLIEKLTTDISSLDGANIHTLVGSEKQVHEVLAQLQDALDEIEIVEKRLTAYEDKLSGVREMVVDLEEKNRMLQTKNTNKKALLDELSSFLSQQDLKEEYVNALNAADFSNVSLLIKASDDLQRALNPNVSSCLTKMSAYQEQKKKHERLKVKFSQKLQMHLKNMFTHLSSVAAGGEGVTVQPVEELSLAGHSAIHRLLRPFTPLVRWMRDLDPAGYSNLLQAYCTAASRLYSRDIQQFFQDAHRIMEKKGEGDKSDEGSWLKALSSSPKSSNVAPLLGADREQFLHATATSTWDAQRRVFEGLVERLLGQLEPVCLAEQDFCLRFFHMEERSKKQKELSLEMRKMMSALFVNLEPEFLAFMSHYEKVDSHYCMILLVRLSKHVLRAEDTGSFLAVTFGSALIQAKRSFDKMMSLHITSLHDYKSNRSRKAGILPFILNFEDFAKAAERIFEGSHRRTDLEKWYSRICAVIFETVERIAKEHGKTPSQVIRMENYHHLFSVLSELKITALEKERKETKSHYKAALDDYVNTYFGHPLEKLHVFFEGVQTKVAEGVKESEIGYQLAFSKQELRRLIKEYPKKEVQKGLQHLYQKVERHLSEDESLLQVVWRAMQEEFIKQYKGMDELIQRCYPGAQISLEFNIDDILEIFSEIAQLH